MGLIQKTAINKIQTCKSFPYALKNNEIVVDNFAGGGGASSGVEVGLNRHVDIAINHDIDAIDMHKLNHPETEHHCESVWDVDPIKACRGRPVGYGWFSPDCKHYSKARGGKPVDKSIRCLPWVTVRWALLVPMRIFTVENVEEFRGWGPLITKNGKAYPCKERAGETFDGFIKALSTGLSPQHPAWKEAVSSLNIQYDIQAKLKLKKGLGYDLEHRSISACDYGAPTIRKRFFLIGRNDGAKIVWPKKTHGKKGSGLIPFKTAGDIIDWSIPVKSIYNRKKPLVEKTIQRINRGLQKYVFGERDPFIVPQKCSVPFIHENDNVLNCAHDKDVLITSHMIKMRGTNTGHGTDEPVHTISAGGLHIGEVRAFLVKYYGTSSAADCNKPLDTVTTKDRFALVVIKGEKYTIRDIGMRMLSPAELFAAQGFHQEYIIDINSQGKPLSKQKQVARCGNAVCPPVAQAISAVNVGQDTPENWLEAA